MSCDEQITDLLLRWEDHREQGQLLTAEELCANRPELVSEVRAQIQAILSMDALIGPTRQNQGSGDTERSQPDQTQISPQKSLATQSTYRIVRSHARGGLGEVLVAKDEALGREVALKVMQPTRGADDERQRRFENEAAITSLLEHPGIVPVYGIGKDDADRPCYAMRFIQGENLREAVRRFHGDDSTLVDPSERSLEFRGLLSRFISVCNTIAYAHSRGVIHRDLKPANIMLGKYGETLVVDWGLAKRIKVHPTSEIADADEVTIDADRQSINAARQSIAAEFLDESAHASHDATRTGQALGTPAYMSPEQAAGDTKRISRASDIYSLGATLFMILTGRAPIDGGHALELLAAVQRGDFPRPRHLRPVIPRPLEAICLKAMALKPSDRYPSATKLAADLEHWLADEPVAAWREPFLERSRRWLRRHRLVVTTAAAAGIVAIAGLVAVLFVTSNSNRRLWLANERESSAKLKAQLNAEVAEQQSDLALATLQSVTNDIQKQLKSMPATHPVRQSLLNTALDGLEKVAAGLDARPKADLSAAFAHRELGDIFLQAGGLGERGGTATAEREFRKAMQICETLDAQTPNRLEIRSELAVCHDKLGDLLLKTNSTEQAQTHYDQAIEIRESLLRAHQDNAAIRRSLSISFVKVGDGQRRLGQLQKARDHYAKAVLVRELALMQMPNDRQTQRDLEVALNKVGDVARQLGSPRDGLDFYLRALDISRRHATEAPHDAQAERDFAFSLGRVADANWELGNWERAYEFHRERMEISERRVAADPRNEEAQADLAVGHERLGDLKVLSGAFDEAMPHFESNLEIWKRQTAADPNNAAARRALAITLARIGSVHRSLRAFEDAQKCFAESLKINEQLAASDSKNTRARLDWANSIQRAGDVEFELNHPEDARTLYGRLLELGEQLMATNEDDPKFQVLYAIGLHRMGRLEQSLKHPQLALPRFERSLRILKQLEAGGTLSLEHKGEILQIEKAIAEMRQPSLIE